MDKKTIAHQNPIAPSELIVTDEGRIYHLDLHPDDIADDIIVVGDQVFCMVQTLTVGINLWRVSLGRKELCPVTVAQCFC